MYVSIDGKIDGAYMDEEGCNISGEYYDDVIFKKGSSMASGRVTTKMYKAKADTDISYFEEEKSNADFIINANHYNFVFDRMGKCFYDDVTYTYGGKTMQIVEVVSKKCNKKYLSYLKSIKISYIIADTIKEALNKIYEKFKVERLVLTGGATINGGFLKENLIDEISLIVAPYVEGNDNYKQSIGSMSSFINQKFNFESAKRLNDGGVELIFKREK